MHSSTLVVAAILAFIVATSACFSKDSRPASQPAGAPKAAADGTHVHMDTTFGDFVIELYPLKAPNTVKNFLAYVDSGFYENTVFHRIMKGFMAQCGGYTPSDSVNPKKTRPAIANEADNGLKNIKYTVAMARTGKPHSATSQFFINAKHNVSLDHRSKASDGGWGYCVFGKVIGGTATVDALLNTPVTRNRKGETSKPITTPVILKATRIPDDGVAAAIKACKVNKEAGGAKSQTP